MVSIPICRLNHASDLPLPRYETEDAAGMDLAAAVVESFYLDPGERALIPTGLTIALPSGYEAQIRPRSGLALRYGVTVLNAPGTIDADYRGEIGVILINLGKETFKVERGMRIAQLVAARVSRVTWDKREMLPESSRGGDGFGSTGIGEKERIRE